MSRKERGELLCNLSATLSHFYPFVTAEAITWLILRSDSVDIVLGLLAVMDRDKCTLEEAEKTLSEIICTKTGCLELGDNGRLRNSGDFYCGVFLHGGRGLSWEEFISPEEFLGDTEEEEEEDSGPLSSFLND